jgi:hypothetical protein
MWIHLQSTMANTRSQRATAREAEVARETKLVGLETVKEIGEEG